MAESTQVKTEDATEDSEDAWTADQWLKNTEVAFRKVWDGASGGEDDAHGDRVNDFEYELWEEFQQKFATGQVEMVKRILRLCAGKQVDDEALGRLYLLIARNTDVFHYCRGVAAWRKQLIATYGR